MSNLRIVSNNIALTAVLSASSQAGDLAVQNLQLDSKSQVARSIGTSYTITATFTSTPVSCASLPICNLSSTATMRIRVYTLSGHTSPVLDTGNILCCEYTTIDKIDFGSGALNAKAYAYGGGTYASLFFASTTAEKIIIDIIDSANPSSYIEACFLVIGDYFTPVYNAQLGAQIAINDASKSSRNESGDLMITRGARYKIISFTLGLLQSADATAMIEILIRNGTSIPLFMSFYPESSDQQEKQHYQIYGYMMSNTALTRFSHILQKTSLIKIQEK